MIHYEQQLKQKEKEIETIAEDLNCVVKESQIISIEYKKLLEKFSSLQGEVRCRALVYRDLNQFRRK